MIATRDWTAVEDGDADDGVLTISGHVGVPTIEGSARLDLASTRGTTLFLSIRFEDPAATDIHLRWQSLGYVAPARTFERVRILFEGRALEDLAVTRRGGGPSDGPGPIA